MGYNNTVHTQKKRWQCVSAHPGDRGRSEGMQAFLAPVFCIPHDRVQVDGSDEAREVVLVLIKVEVRVRLRCRDSG